MEIFRGSAFDYVSVSSYWHRYELMVRFTTENNHGFKANFNATYGSKRPRLCENYLTASIFGTVLKK